MSTIRPSILARLAPLQLAAVRRIEAEDLSYLLEAISAERTRVGRPVSGDYLLDAELGLKQFYLLACLAPDDEHAMPVSIDPVWERHIGTPGYAVFSDEVFGRLLGHVPFRPEQAAEATTMYNTTLVAVEAMFAQVSPLWQRQPGKGEPECFHSAAEVVGAKCFHHPVETH